MFKYSFCSEMKYKKLRNAWWTYVDACWSQENVRIKLFGILIAYSQPDMLSDDMNPPDMCWCLRVK